MHDLFKKRHSAREYLTKDISEAQMMDIMEAAKSAPSAGNLKAREIMVVRDKSEKSALANAANGQEFIASAPRVMVFFAVPPRSAARYGKRGEELFAIQDATIAASFAWMQAILWGLGACWVGGFNEEALKDYLKIDNKDWKPVVIMPIGYEEESI